MKKKLFVFTLRHTTDWQARKKLCTGCKQILPVESFSWCSKKDNRLAHLCKTCFAHRRLSFRRHPARTDGYKTCSLCGNKQSIVEFVKIPRNKDGRAGQCRTCWNARNQKLASTPQAREKQRLSRLEYDRLHPYHQKTRLYGITAGQYQAMLQEQGGCCAICGNGAKEKLGVDHNHKTGKVRGLLCGLCNAGLGNYKDCRELLARASAYLERTDPIKTVELA